MTQNGTPALFCGSCKHWWKRPAEPDATGAIDMSLPVIGECRHSPPTGTTHLTNRGPITMSAYPPLGEDFPACAQHEAGKPVLTT